MSPLLEALTRYGFSVVPPDHAFLKWCLEKGLSGPLLSTLKDGWVEETDGGFGENGANIFGPDAIVAEAAEFPQFLRDGFLAIGSAANGDPIALDIRSGAVVYLSHDELWGDEDLDAREYSVEIAPTLDGFAALATAGELAIDYWETLDRDQE